MECSMCGRGLGEGSIHIKDGILCQRCSIGNPNCSVCGAIFRAGWMENTICHGWYLVCPTCVANRELFGNCPNCETNTLLYAFYTTNTNTRVCFRCVNTRDGMVDRPYARCQYCDRVVETRTVRRHPNGCVYCPRCCPDEFTLKQTRKPVLSPPDRVGRNDFLADTFCGLEVECCHQLQTGKDLVAHDKRWGWVHDGSITPPNGYYGLEFLSPILWGNRGLVSLSGFLDVLNNNGKAIANQSCGLHVHIQSSDLSPKQVSNVLLGWLSIQDWASQTVPTDRRVKRHCLPLKLNKETLLSVTNELELAKAVYGKYLTQQQLDSLKIEKYVGIRYSNLNPHSHFHHGTLEFRLHPGTTNFRDIYRWMEVCSKLVSIAKDKEELTLECFLNHLDKSTVNHYNEKIKLYSTTDTPF